MRHECPALELTALARLPASYSRVTSDLVPTLDRDGDVFVLNLGDSENRFHPDWLVEVQAHLDTVAEREGPRALVTTATGKYFSNGLDLEWLQANTG